MVRVGRRPPFPGAPFELSELTLAAAPQDTAVDGATAVALLRRAWNEGITTFDTVDVPNPAVAEMLLARAFPDPEPSLVVLSGAARAPAPAALPRLDRGLGPPKGAPGEDLRSDPSRSPFRRLVEVDAAAGEPTPDRPEGHPVGPPLTDTGIVVRCRSWEELLAVRDRHRAGLVAVDLSLLNLAFATAAAREAPDPSLGWIVRDPFAGGRLDGRRFDRRLSAPLAAPPPSVRDLEAEFAPVARFRFLARPGRRTLAQAALRFVLDRPGVATACIPMPPVERWEEIVGYRESAPLEEVERATIEALAEASTSRGDLASRSR